MRLLHLTILCSILTAFSSDPTSESSRTTTSHVDALATNVLFQSKDGGMTWQDISYTLPEYEEPEDFFASESDLYIRTVTGMYHSKSMLKAPVWQKQDDRAVSIDFNRSEIVEADGVLIATGQRGIKRSTDKGEHWEWVISEGGVGIAVEKIKRGFAAISYNTTIKSRRIHISMDSGKTWKAIDQGLQPALSISSIKQIGDYLIVGHPDGIFRSSDMGKTWNIVHPPVDGDEVKFVVRVNNNDPSNDQRKVFKIYVSGNVVYAVAASGGC